MRPFLAPLGESPALRAALAGQAVLAAVRALLALAARRVGAKPLQEHEIDPGLVPAAWRPVVYGSPALPVGAVDWDSYVVCVLEQLHRALRDTATD